MAKDFSLAEALEPYCRHDPVSGQLRCYMRTTHDVTRSQRVRLMRRCVGAETRGLRHRGMGAVADTLATRRALAEAARVCRERVHDRGVAATTTTLQGRMPA